jgi:ATP-dependent helicase HrpA
MQFRREFRDLRKECDKLLRLPAHGWLIYQGVGSRDTFCRDLLRFMVEEIFACRAGIIPTLEQFEAASAAAGQKGVYRLGQALLNQVLEVLTDRRDTLDHINKFEQLDKQKGSPKIAVERGDLYRRQLARLLPADFLATFDRERLTAAARYFKGLRIRVERAHVSPDKDLAKAEKLAPFEARLEQDPRPATETGEEGQRLLEEYRTMLEEFRISLFAPEIKTALPVSEKRLEKKWREYKEL